jgi:hypothetical protein
VVLVVAVGLHIRQVPVVTLARSTTTSDRGYALATTSITGVTQRLGAAPRR